MKCKVSKRQEVGEKGDAYVRCAVLRLPILLYVVGAAGRSKIGKEIRQWCGPCISGSGGDHLLMGHKWLQCTCAGA